MNKRMQFARSVLLLVGILAVLVGYYWVHKPFNFVMIGALGGAALDGLAAALLAAAGGGLGRRLLTALDPQSDGLRVYISRAERLALESLLGLGTLSVLALLLGLTGLYTGAAFWGLLLGVALLTARALFGWLRDLRAVARLAAQPSGGWPRFLMLLTVVLLVTALLRAFTPPTAYDALNYHLVGPARYLAAGRIAAHADNFFLGFSQGAEVLYGVAMGLFGRDTAAAPVHYVLGLLGLLAVGGLARRRAGEAAGWLAVVLLLSAFSLWLLFGWPYVDLALLAYGAAPLVAAGAWRESRRTAWLIVLGLLVGLALGVKYTAAGLGLAAVVYAAWQEPRRIVRNGMILALAAGLAYAPWAIKGVLLYHNPIYPFIFNGLNWDAARSYLFNTPGTGLIATGRGWQLITLPLAATILGVERGEGFSFTAGPWLLTAPLLLPLVWRGLDARARRLAADCAAFGLPLLAFWLFLAATSSIGAQTRLMAMALPAAAVAGAVGIGGLSHWPRRPFDMAFIMRAVLALTLLLGALDAVRETVQTRAVPVLLGLVSRDSYIEQQLGAYPLIMRRLNDLPPGARVRLMWEPRTYLCPVVCKGDLLFDHWARALRQEQTPAAVFAAWREMDDYLLVYDAGYDFWRADERLAAENARFPAALAEFMTPVWTEGGYTLYGW